MQRQELSSRWAGNRLASTGSGHATGHATCGLDVQNARSAPFRRGTWNGIRVVETVTCGLLVGRALGLLHVDGVPHAGSVPIEAVRPPGLGRGRVTRAER